MNLNIVLAITRKDLIDAIRHRYLLTALVTPLFVALLFRVMLPSMNSGKLLNVVVHDAGGSGLVAELRQTRQIGVVEAASADAIAKEVETRKAIGGLVVPANFDSEMAAGKQPELTVYVNNDKTPFEQAAFRQLLDRMVRAFAKQPEPARLVWVDIAKDENRPSGRAGLDQMLLPLLLILTFGMTGAFVVPLLIVEEKEKRTLDFLLSSPASLREILAGKALTGMAYTLLIAGLLLGLNRASVRNWSLTFLTVVVGLLFVVAVGLVVGSLLKNTMQVNTWASLVLMVLLAPGIPSIGISRWFDTVMRFIPTYYLSEALKLSMAGAVSSRLWMHLAVLLGCTIVVFFGAVWALKRRS